MRVAIDVPDKKGRPLLRFTFWPPAQVALVESFFPSGEIQHIAKTTIEDVHSRLAEEKRTPWR